MQSPTKTEIDEVMRRLKHEEIALAGKKKSQPVIVYLHKRWHLLTLGFLVDEKMHTKRGISNINFMSSARARKYIAEELNFCKIVARADVLPHFAEELTAKVLPAATDYRPLIEKGLVQLAGGFTTDTLSTASVDPNTIEAHLNHLADVMHTGPMGPFLHFELFFTAIIQK